MTDIDDNGADRETAGVNAVGVASPIPRVPRVCVQMPMVVYASEEQGQPFYDDCKTIHVNPQGALLAIARSVVLGQTILLINPKSEKEIVCHIKSVNPDESGVNHVEVEFLKESPEFWRIEFPAEGSDPAECESPQSSAPASDPSIRPLPGPFAEPSLDGAPETGAGTSSEPTEIRKGQEETAELLTKPNMDPLTDPERGGMSEPKSKQAGETTQNADKGASRETTGARAPVVRKSTRRVPRLHLKMPVLVSLPGESSHEGCETVKVASLGALLAVSRSVHVGQELLLTDPNSLNQIACHVRNVEEIGPGVNHVGVEFATESDKFWGMTFPSEDWDPAERKLPQRPIRASEPSFRTLPSQSLPGMPKTAGGTSSKPAGLPVEPNETSKLTLKRWRVLSWPTLVLAGLLGLIFLLVARSYRSSTESVPAVSSAIQDIAPEEARLIPRIENYRLATPGDFDTVAVSWLTNSGQQVSGEILRCLLCLRPVESLCFGRQRRDVAHRDFRGWTTSLRRPLSERRDRRACPQTGDPENSLGQSSPRRLRGRWIACCAVRE